MASFIPEFHRNLVDGKVILENELNKIEKHYTELENELPERREEQLASDERNQPDECIDVDCSFGEIVWESSTLDNQPTTSETVSDNEPSLQHIKNRNFKL